MGQGLLGLCGIEGEEEDVRQRAVRQRRERQRRVRQHRVRLPADPRFMPGYARRRVVEFLTEENPEGENDTMVGRDENLKIEFERKFELYGFLKKGDLDRVEGKEIVAEKQTRGNLQKMYYQNGTLAFLNSNDFHSLRTLRIVNDFSLFCDTIEELPPTRSIETLQIDLFHYFHKRVGKVTLRKGRTCQKLSTLSVNNFFQVNLFMSLKRIKLTSIMPKNWMNNDIIGTNWQPFPNLDTLEIMSPMIGDALFLQKKTIFPKLVNLCLDGEDLDDLTQNKCCTLHGVGWWPQNFDNLKSFFIINMPFFNHQPFKTIQFSKLDVICFMNVPRFMKSLRMKDEKYKDEKEVYLKDVIKIQEFMDTVREEEKSEEEEEEEVLKDGNYTICKHHEEKKKMLGNDIYAVVKKKVMFKKE